MAAQPLLLTPSGRLSHQIRWLSTPRGPEEPMRSVDLVRSGEYDGMAPAVEVRLGTLMFS